MEQTTLINRVAESGIITIDLEEMYPAEEIVLFDLKDYLFHGLILKEKEFRQSLAAKDWTEYTDKIVLIQCSTDAIIPLWAYMLVSSYLTEIARDVFHGQKDEYLSLFFKNQIETIDVVQYTGKRVVLKGCSKKAVPAQAYASMTFRLKPVVQSLMFGEPCSTVPIFKKSKTE